MSFLGVTPEAVTSAAGHLGTVGSALSAANAAAAGPTTGLAAMAADDVSAAVQSMFATYAQAYQSVGAQVEAFHSQFVSLLNGGAASYLSSEIANARQVLGGGAPVSAAGVITGPGVTGGGNTVVTLARFGQLTLFETITPSGQASITVGLIPSHFFTAPLPPQVADFLLHSGL
jgi:PE family